MLNPHFVLATRNAMLDRITTDLGTSALFTIYAGGQPADTSAALTAGNTIVASLTFPTTNAFAAAAAGVLTANALGADASASGGTATFFSLRKNTGLRIADGSVGTSGADLNLNSVAISTGASVAVSSFTVTFPA